MRGFLVGLGWFLILLLAQGIVVALVVPSLLDIRSDQAFEAGRTVGHGFAPLFFLVALIGTVLGTRLGILPGSSRFREKP